MRENIYSWAPTSNEVDSNILVVEMHEQNGEPLPITDKFGGELKTQVLATVRGRCDDHGLSHRCSTHPVVNV